MVNVFLHMKLWGNIRKVNKNTTDSGIEESGLSENFLPSIEYEEPLFGFFTAHKDPMFYLMPGQINYL